MKCEPIAQTSHGAAAAVHSPCYVEPAPLADVMLEQMEYLLAHAARPCPPACVDCARLAEVRRLLLLPFAMAA